MIEGCVDRLAYLHNTALKIHNEEKGPMPAALATVQETNNFFSLKSVSKRRVDARALQGERV